MAEKHGSGTYPTAIYDRKVGMADPSHLDAHEEFTGARGIQFQPADRERSGCREGRLRPAVLQYGAEDLH